MPEGKSEILKRAEALVHLLRDLSADVDEVEEEFRATPDEIRKLASALMRDPEGRC